MLGDSLTARAEWAELLGRSAINRGINNDSIDSVRARLADIVALRPKAVFLLIGINDLLAGGKPADVAARHEALVREMRMRLPGATISVQSLLPVHEDMLRKHDDEFVSNATILEANALIAARARAAGARWVDVHKALTDASGQLDARYTRDGLHMSAAGYRVWADALRPYLP
jgi:lysophospholipase L1-like esterase